MKLNKEKMLKSIRNYFENTSKEDLIRDLKKTGSWELINAAKRENLAKIIIETEIYREFKMISRSSSVNYSSRGQEQEASNALNDYVKFYENSIRIHVTENNELGQNVDLNLIGA